MCCPKSHVDKELSNAGRIGQLVTALIPDGPLAGPPVVWQREVEILFGLLSGNMGSRFYPAAYYLGRLS